MFNHVFLVLFSLLSGVNSPTLTSNNALNDKPKAIDNKQIIWNSNRKLTWDDFQKEADANDPLHAMASTNIAVSATCRNSVMVYDVKCQFSPNESWTKNKVSVDLLQHEQLHFDITELYARQLRQKLSQQKSLCSGDKNKFKAVVNKVFADWQKAQTRYDNESHHGIDDVKQAAWSQTITTQLDGLSAFQLEENNTAGL
ncbi:DUF922 domain-containing protein [Adhaeribacter pallidiroseus]|uniref:DUF922 domain-containing protein n=1 Tax=Adhaeribacter pallidiroseus TaxID=2072847 RepID=A0A369QK30_9BACT|nr:DUF922 domain-containing protein [Adhaeribacter pallidiroseus]RDC62618.1 hypothetical protein AHMF7616_01212 [Adhaeribacter pallidiroseus]